MMISSGGGSWALSSAMAWQRVDADHHAAPRHTGSSSPCSAAVRGGAGRGRPAGADHGPAPCRGSPPGVSVHQAGEERDAVLHLLRADRRVDRSVRSHRQSLSHTGVERQQLTARFQRQELVAGDAIDPPVLSSAPPWRMTASRPSVRSVLLTFRQVVNQMCSSALVRSQARSVA